jgi:hypothetical protein
MSRVQSKDAAMAVAGKSSAVGYFLSHASDPDVSCPATE